MFYVVLGKYKGDSEVWNLLQGLLKCRLDEDDEDGDVMLTMEVMLLVLMKM